MAYEVKKLNKKMLEAIEIQLNEPTISQIELAERLGVHARTAHNYVNSEVYKEEFNKRLKEKWANSEKIAVKTMIDLASEGNRQAAEYILNSLGYQAPTQIEVNTNTIKVTIDEEGEN